MQSSNFTCKRLKNLSYINIYVHLYIYAKIAALCSKYASKEYDKDNKKKPGENIAFPLLTVIS